MGAASAEISSGNQQLAIAAEAACMVILPDIWKIEGAGVGGTQAASDLLVQTVGVLFPTPHH